MLESFTGLFILGQKTIIIKFFQQAQGRSSGVWQPTLIIDEVMIPSIGDHIGFASDDEDFKQFISDGKVSRDGWIQKIPGEESVSPYFVTRKESKGKILLCETMYSEPCNLPQSLIDKYLQN